MDLRQFAGRFSALPTPFYFYDTELLRQTLSTAVGEANKYGYKLHYALKANFNERILAIVREYGLGMDCVSGNEVRAALASGTPAEEIVFAGVAKSDAEIILGLEAGIFSFNCESRQELEVIHSIAGRLGKKARIALRINPDVDPKTHKYISTGKADNKFGISYREVDETLAELEKLAILEIVGLHFHIGSQIRDLSVFEKLCHRVNEIRSWFEERGIQLDHINLGGGLGVDYTDPDAEPIPDFANYFRIVNDHLKVTPEQTVHFELGRSLVGQCGSLITRVLYNKKTAGGSEVVLVDAGMTELIRPALYHAHHHIENLTADRSLTTEYTVAGPICESSDVFASGICLPVTLRGDLLALRSAGAYGRTMASNYNLREFPAERFSEDF